MMTKIRREFSPAMIQFLLSSQKKHKNKTMSQATSKGIRSIVDASVLRKDDVYRLLYEEFKDLTTHHLNPQV